MSFIFLSYSKSRRDLTEALADHLVSEGYEVWWDTSLISGDVYAHVIRDKLNEAAAVIVIWSENAIKSDWVYSEAARANKQKKLIQVLSEGVDPSDLPLPFDARHVDALENREAILRALGKLSVPRASPNLKQDDNGGRHIAIPTNTRPAVAEQQKPEISETQCIPAANETLQSATDANASGAIASKVPLTPVVPRTGPHVIGIIGLPGAGKTSVGAILNKHEVPIIDQADLIFDLLDKPGPAAEAMFTRFGKSLEQKAGRLYHKGLALTVSHDTTAQEGFHRVLYSYVVERELNAVKGLGEHAVVAVLVRMIGFRNYDELWCVVADDDVMINRRGLISQGNNLYAEGSRYDYSVALLPLGKGNVESVKEWLVDLAARVIDTTRPNELAAQVEDALREAGPPRIVN